jgi:hypothetical protein
VINEFLALNDSAQADQDGEFDDWIELFNNSDELVGLGGYYLSDNPSDLPKWKFPDTSLAPHDYLIIWADEDGAQNGLHANFKLSGGGEILFLLNPDTQIIDEISFGQQIQDKSMGRYPDGDGDFQVLVPSFSSKNSETVDSNENRDDNFPGGFELSQNFPNPFNPETRIKFFLSKQSHTRLTIYDLLGKEVFTLVDAMLNSGRHIFTWDGRDKHNQNVASGVYFYSLISVQNKQTKKLVLIR